MAATKYNIPKDRILDFKWLARNFSVKNWDMEAQLFIETMNVNHSKEGPSGSL